MSSGALRDPTLFYVTLGLLICVSALIKSNTYAVTNQIPLSAKDITPLKVGDLVPSATLATVEGKPFDLRKMTQGKPTVLIFYRGGW